MRHGKITYYICHICNRAKGQAYRDSHKGWAYKAQMKYRYKKKARNRVYFAVKAGKLIRPKKCPICKEFKDLDAHHEDYTKPLEVIWACRKCHRRKWHK